MATNGKDIAIDADQKEYWYTRGYEESSRLSLLSWVWKLQLGYTLHPSITFSRQDGLRVADVGCGNGSWLLEMSQELSAYARLEGFDLADNLFPARELWPDNLTGFRKLDALAELPSDLVGAFDIVHTRMITTAVLHNESEPLIKNLVKMLKPGGFIQWDEAWASEMNAFKSDRDGDNTATVQLCQILRASSNIRHKTDWLSRLPDDIEKQSVQRLFWDTIPTKQCLYKAWAENFMTIFRSMAYRTPTNAEAGPDAPMTREKLIALIHQASEEIMRGHGMAITRLSVYVGQKEGS